MPTSRSNTDPCPPIQTPYQKERYTVAPKTKHIEDEDKDLNVVQRRAKADTDRASDTRQLLERRKQAMTSVAERLNRVLTGDQRLTAEMAKPNYIVGGSPAWTTGAKVYFNQERFDELLTPDRNGAVDLHRAARVFFGTNYHEIAHVMFSPRANDKVTIMLRDFGTSKGDVMGVWHAYMKLEDQRIETMYTTLYKPTTHYFQSAVMRWLLENGVSENLYTLIYGRKFLDFDIRKQCRKLFVAENGEDVTRQIEDIIDDYLTVVFPLDSLKAHSLVVKFYNLIRNRPTPSGGCEGLPTELKAGKRSPDEAVEAVRQVAQDLEDDKDAIREPEDDPEDTGDDTDTAEDSGDSETGDESGAGDGDGESDDLESGDGRGSGNGKGDGEDGDGDDEGDGGGDTPGQGIGTAGVSKADTRHLKSEITEMIKESLTQVESAPETKEELNKAVTAVRSESEQDLSVSGEYNNYQERHVPEQLIHDSNRIVAHIQRLKSEADPQWLRAQSAGRLDVRRALRRRQDPSFLDIYDRWDEGAEEQSTVEVVMLIDLSSSMTRVMPMLSESLWILKRSFDRTDVRTTVLGFAGTHVPLYKPQEKLTTGTMRMFNASGGTNPTTAFQTAHHIFSRSDATNKLLVTLTDGMFGAGGDPLVRSMRRAGVMTALYEINTGYSGAGANAYGERNRHGHEIIGDLNKASDLTLLVRRLVEEMIAAAAL